jgi:iron complex transport system ATP-binding protein
MKKEGTIFAVEKLRVEREAVILRDVSWRVERGQHWAILGANGSGKTSLLSALTGYLVPTSGDVRIGTAQFGAADWREVRTAVGLVSASLGHQIQPEQTAREVVLSGRHAQINFWGRVPAAEGREAARILRQVRATYLAERPWRYLSQGERQRILIGRALMARLTMLFLDEPCAGLDPVAREDFLVFLEKLARRRHAPTLVLVTHHVEEIVPLFTHVLMLSRGSVLASGEKDAVLTSARLSETFGSLVKLRRTGGRYRLHVARHASSFAR